MIHIDGAASMGALDPDQIAPSRSDLAAETDRLDAEIKQLARDRFDSVNETVSGSTLGQWNTFVADWKRWNWGPYAIAHVFTKTWLDELVRFQERFNAFLDAFRAAGVQTSISRGEFISDPGIIDEAIDAIGEGAKDLAAAPKKALDTITTTLIVGGIVVAGLYVFTIYEAGRSIRAGARLL